MFSSVPPDDPAYVTGNLGGMTILHYIVGPVLFIATVPVLLLGLIPAGALLAVADEVTWHIGLHIGSHTFGVVALCIECAITIAGYGYWIVWRLCCRKILGGLFRALF